MAKSAYDVYLDNCLLPVTPEKIQISINNNNSTVNLINEGEINILKKAGLTDIEFEAEIPQVKHPYAVYKDGFQGAGYYFDIFEKLKTGKKPFQFIVCRNTPANKKLLNTNMKVSLEDYTITEEAGNGFDFRVKFKLKQYREYGTKTINIKLTVSKPKASAEPQRETNNSPAPATPSEPSVNNNSTTTTTTTNSNSSTDNSDRSAHSTTTDNSRRTETNDSNNTSTVNNYYAQEQQPSSGGESVQTIVVPAGNSGSGEPIEQTIKVEAPDGSTGADGMTLNVNVNVGEDGTPNQEVAASSKQPDRVSWYQVTVLCLLSAILVCMIKQH